MREVAGFRNEMRGQDNRRKHYIAIGIPAKRVKGKSKPHGGNWGRLRRIPPLEKGLRGNYAARVLDAVAHPPSRIETMAEPATAGPEHIASTEPPATPLPTREFVDFFDYDTETTQRVPIEVYRAPDSFPALPAYEYWTPNARNIFHGDDPDDLPFLREYTTFSWEEPPVDPDLEVVVLEAARRLHTDDHMLYHHIDETAVLPLELLDRDGARGMLYKSQRCDFPDWPPGVPHSAKRLKTDTAPLPNSPDNALALLTETFCINLNCTVGFCSTHHDPTPVAPLVKSDRMNGLAGTPCGDDCFLLKSSGDEPIQWSVDDTQLLCTILDFSPDTLPCDLGVVCAKPCCEVFEQRKTIVPDATIKRPKPKAKKSTLTRNGSSLGKSSSNSPDSKQFTPCAVLCILVSYPKSRVQRDALPTRRFLAMLPRSVLRERLSLQPKITKVHIAGRAATVCLSSGTVFAAQRAARASSRTASATRRFVGSVRQKVKENLPGFSSQLTSYPDAQADLCRNADIQRAKWKRTKVAPARWGMGLFIAETAAVGHLIIAQSTSGSSCMILPPYLASNASPSVVSSRFLINRISYRPIAQHRGRNYVFELNNTMSIDSTYVGNDARYISHDAQTSNCAAKGTSSAVRCLGASVWSMASIVSASTTLMSNALLPLVDERVVEPQRTRLVFPNPPSIIVQDLYHVQSREDYVARARLIRRERARLEEAAGYARMLAQISLVNEITGYGKYQEKQRRQADQERRRRERVEARSLVMSLAQRPPPAPRRPAIRLIAPDGRRRKRDTPLTVEDLYLDDARPPDIAYLKLEHICILCLGMKSHPVSYFHCFVCVRVRVETSWSCPECGTIITRPPRKSDAEEAAIEADFGNWDKSKVSYSWADLSFPRPRYDTDSD
ncbi:hypothetical protein C8R47DRAFT_1204601 [Mycena vitilis]|nr:hypothetical protein C8R47DRAFT_1204601 [Mycena vitilis]